MSQEPIVYCPKCKQAFDSTQAREFFAGNYITCETCGYGFRRYIHSAAAIPQKITREASPNLNLSRILGKVKNLVKNIFRPAFPQPQEMTGKQRGQRYPDGLRPEYDPITGEKLQDRQNGKKDHTIKMHITHETLSRIYTVLDIDIRNQLRNLEVTDAERALMAKSFIYLTREQQQKYLDELHTHHVIDQEEEIPSKEIQELIASIRTIPIPQSQQDYLIEQLHFIPEGEKKDFILFLQHSEEH